MPDLEPRPRCLLPGQREAYAGALIAKREAIELEILAEEKVEKATGGLNHQRSSIEAAEEFAETVQALHDLEKTPDCSPSDRVKPLLESGADLRDKRIN